MTKQKITLLVTAFALLMSSFSSLSWASWDATDAGGIPGRQQVLKVDFGVQTPQGIILQKDEKFGRPYYMISLFAFDSVYKSIVVPKGIFETKYENFRNLYRKIVRRHKGLSCSVVAKVDRKTDAAPVVQQDLCRDSFTPQDRAHLLLWQKDIQSLVSGYGPTKTAAR